MRDLLLERIAGLEALLARLPGDGLRCMELRARIDELRWVIVNLEQRKDLDGHRWSSLLTSALLIWRAKPKCASP